MSYTVSFHSFIFVPKTYFASWHYFPGPIVTHAPTATPYHHLMHYTLITNFFFFSIIIIIIIFIYLLLFYLFVFLGSFPICYFIYLPNLRWRSQTDRHSKNSKVKSWKMVSSGEKWKHRHLHTKKKNYLENSPVIHNSKQCKAERSERLSLIKVWL